MNIGDNTHRNREGDGTQAEAMLDPGLEAALRDALAPGDVPAGFADRVTARALAGDAPFILTTPRPVASTPPPALAAPTLNAPAATPPRGKLLAWSVRPLWVRGSIAAALALGLLEGESLYRQFREQQRRIAEATAQFQTTERVTVRALAQAREQLQRAGVPLTLD